MTNKEWAIFLMLGTLVAGTASTQHLTGSKPPSSTNPSPVHVESPLNNKTSIASDKPKNEPIPRPVHHSGLVWSGSSHPDIKQATFYSLRTGTVAHILTLCNGRYANNTILGSQGSLTIAWDKNCQLVKSDRPVGVMY